MRSLMILTADGTSFGADIPEGASFKDQLEGFNHLREVDGLVVFTQGSTERCVPARSIVLIEAVDE